MPITLGMCRHHPALVALARCWPGSAHEAQRDVARAWLAVLCADAAAASVRARAGAEVTRLATTRTNLALQPPAAPAIDVLRFFGTEHELWPQEWTDPPRPWGRNAARRLSRRDMPQLLERRTRELGLAAAAALTLRDIHGWPLPECAAALALSEPQARALLRDAREGLRAVLEAEVDSA